MNLPRIARTAFFLAIAALLSNVALAQPAAPPKPKQPGPRLLPGIKAMRDVAYVENGHERNRLDLFVPENPQGKLPLVVWIHGGAWKGGSKEGCPAMFLLGKGYAVASINYRYSQQAIFPAQIEDCKAAIRWLRANADKYSLDSKHVGVWGGSAGGHLVALLGTSGSVKELEGKGGNADQSSTVQAVVDWYGPSDLTVMGDLGDGPIAQLLGGPTKEHLDQARKASPVVYVSKESAPFLIMHGDEDKVVPIVQSERLAAALKKAGVEVDLQVIHKNGHGGPGFTDADAHKTILEFFDKHLKAG